MQSKNGSPESIHKDATFFWCSRCKIVHHEKFERLNNRFKNSLIGPNNSFNNLDFKFHKQLNHGKGNWASFWDVPRKSIHFYHNYIRTQEATLIKIFSKIAFLYFYPYDLGDIYEIYAGYVDARKNKIGLKKWEHENKVWFIKKN